MTLIVEILIEYHIALLQVTAIGIQGSECYSSLRFASELRIWTYHVILQAKINTIYNTGISCVAERLKTKWDWWVSSTFGPNHYLELEIWCWILARATPSPVRLRKRSQATSLLGNTLQLLTWHNKQTSHFTALGECWEHTLSSIHKECSMGKPCLRFLNFTIAAVACEKHC